jgi:PAS domain S-box-containing protein
MEITFILATSVVLQATAIVVALSLARETELKRAWLAIAGALLLMMIPRSITLIKLVSGAITRPPEIESELVALDVSFLLGVGMAWVSRLFCNLKRAHAELIRSQKVLLENENRLKILFEHAPDASFLLDLEGKVVDVNRAAELLTGADRQSLIHSHASANPLVPNVEDQAQPVAGPDNTAEANTPRPWLVTRPDGRRVITELRSYLVDIGGTPYLLATVRDLTESRRAEEEKRKLEAQLRHLERMQTVGTLAGGIAHDFNNILSPILGYAEMAAQELKSGAPRDHLEHVIRAAYRARDLIQQILIFSRQTEMDYRPLQLQPLVKEVMKLLRASLPATIEIECQFDDDGEVVYADASQIHQVVMNLCTNAAYAMREKGGTLRVSLAAVEVDPAAAAALHKLRAGRHVRLCVSDTGRGIEPAVLEHIFEPFFTTKPAGEGTGLGLALVHGIVIAHGGAIAVDSTPGMGTTFSIYFPVGRVAPQTEPVLETSLPCAESVLLVDDDPEIALLVEQMLSRLGCRVTVKTNSRDALEVFRSAPEEYDIVITDLAMPRMTGVQLSLEIKGIRPDIPVVLMTGFSDQITAENCRQWGLDGFVLKPIISSVLSQTIRRIMTRREVSPPS